MKFTVSFYKKTNKFHLFQKRKKEMGIISEAKFFSQNTSFTVSLRLISFSYLVEEETERKIRDRTVGSSRTISSNLLLKEKEKKKYCYFSDLLIVSRPG